MDRLPVDPGAEVGEGVQPRFLTPPVVALAPVLDQRAEVVDGDSVLPPRSFNLVREARPFQAIPEITEDSVIDGDAERLDRVARRSHHGRGYPRGAFPARFVELVHAR